MKTLETDRLILRDWCEDDAAECFALWNNPEIEHAGWIVKNDMDEIHDAMHAWMLCQDS